MCKISHQASIPVYWSISYRLVLLYGAAYVSFTSYINSTMMLDMKDVMKENGVVSF
jgi:hypothetical protein